MSSETRVDGTVEIEAYQTRLGPNHAGGLALVGMSVVNEHGIPSEVSMHVDEGAGDTTQIAVHQVISHAGEQVEVITYFHVTDPAIASTIAAAIRAPFTEGPPA